MNRKQHPSLLEARSHTESGAAAHFVYLLTCADGTLYTGYTTDVARRLGEHNAAKAARYTRGRRPVTLLASWPCATKGDALRAERAIKRLSHAEKLRLAETNGSRGRNPLRRNTMTNRHGLPILFPIFPPEIEPS